MWVLIKGVLMILIDIAKWIAIDLGRKELSNVDMQKYMVTGESTIQEIHDSLDK